MALHQCAKNHDMMYSCEVMVWTNRYVILCQFLPLYPLHNLKNKTKTEKHLEILWFYTSVSLIIIICFIAELSLRTNRQVILAFFCPFAPLPLGEGGLKYKIWVYKLKKTIEIISLCTTATKIMVIRCLVAKLWLETKPWVILDQFFCLLPTHPASLRGGWVKRMSADIITSNQCKKNYNLMVHGCGIMTWDRRIEGWKDEQKMWYIGGCT